MDEAGQRWSQADEANLRGSITDLASLVTGHWGLEGLMEQIAQYAVRAIPAPRAWA
ncbi:hypothetical protein [Agilicoccus flavus]|uniref:hypothetical protein n=1 Tax=Agilicoccus flavus TaxID=2775968 RepID=UPI001CF6B2C3|nr:hypothetical protein [Agilicoccus flavus]